MSNSHDTDDYFFREDEWGYGRRMILKSSWKPSYRNVMERAGATGLTLTFPWWRDADLSFLADIPELQTIYINSWNVRDASVISRVPTLKLVGLHCDLRKSIDLSKLPHLEFFMGTWNKHLDSLFTRSGIKHLNLSRYPSNDLGLISNMTGMKRMRLSSTKLSSLNGIEAFTVLEHLVFYMCTNLTSLDGTETLASSLSHLEVVSCKNIQDVSPVSKLKNLKYFDLDGCGEIGTLAPLEGCKNLEILSFVSQSGRILDGDLSFILKFPHMRNVSFTPRRSYSHTPREINAELSRRSH